MTVSENPQKIMDIDSNADTKAAKYFKEVLNMENNNNNGQQQQFDLKGAAVTGAKYTAAAGVGAGATYLLLKKTGSPRMAEDVTEGLKAVGSLFKAFLK